MNIREKVEKEREAFIIQWCKERNLDDRIADNYNKAAAQWAFQNCFK